MEKRPALGKGLSALIPDAPLPPAPAAAASTIEVEIDRLTPNTFQPRGQMDDARLEELARSIKSHGVIQPIIVRRAGERYHIIAGERRWRAAQRAGLGRVPVVVREVGDGKNRSLLEVALIENIQRENLNPMDEAHAYRRLCDEFRLTQEEVAAAVGKDRTTVANTLRLLKLPAEVQAEVAAGGLSMGHARALLALDGEGEQRRIAREVIAKGLSVRETEALTRKGADSPAEPRTATAPPPVDVHTKAAEDRLRVLYGTRVRILRKGTKGRIEIDFANENELIRIYEQLTDGHN